MQFRCCSRKAQSIAAAEQTTKVYSKALVCNGNESSVSKCGQQERNLPCNNVASVTCEGKLILND